MSQITLMNIGEFNQPKQQSSQTALVCNLTALKAEQRERHQVVLKQLGQESHEVREVAKGYAFRFVPGRDRGSPIAGRVYLPGASLLPISRTHTRGKDGP